MKATLYFQSAGSDCIASTADMPDMTFAEFCDRLTSSAPAAMLVLGDTAFPYTRLLRVVKLED